MTIVTKPLTDEKKDLKPLVLDVAGTGGQVNGAVFVDGQDGVSTGSEVVSVYQHPYRKHRTGFFVCLGLLIILTIGCATMGGLYLYYRFSKQEAYRGTCTIRLSNNGPQTSPFEQPPLDGAPFQVDSIPLAGGAYRSLMRNPDNTDPSGDSTIDPMSDLMPTDMRRLFNSFQQQFELDLAKQLFEILQVPRVPQLGLGRPARFIHDFSLNLTAILDMQSQDCYVMPLNRSVIKPPQDLLEFFRGLEAGTYTVDGDAVRQTYYADPLPVDDLTSLGPFIARECRNSPTYMLKSRAVDTDDSSSSSAAVPSASDSLDRVRRDAAASADHVSFGEFAGNSLHRVHIVMSNKRR